MGCGTRHNVYQDQLLPARQRNTHMYFPCTAASQELLQPGSPLRQPTVDAWPSCIYLQGLGIMQYSDRNPRLLCMPGKHCNSPLLLLWCTLFSFPRPNSAQPARLKQACHQLLLLRPWLPSCPPHNALHNSSLWHWLILCQLLQGRGRDEVSSASHTMLAPHRL